jgi:hypothetical protein
LTDVLSADGVPKQNGGRRYKKSETPSFNKYEFIVIEDNLDEVEKVEGIVEVNAQIYRVLIFTVLFLSGTGNWM